MKKLILALFVIFSSCAQADIHGKLPTADHVEVDKYIGKWYAIKAMPQFFTRKCIGQTADYGIINSTKISVLNTCLKAKGKIQTIQGQAVVKNLDTNAELEVTFNNFFTRLFRVKGEYTIIKLADDYSSVMVGESSRKSLWIMSRKPTLESEVLEEYIQLADELGFPTDKLIDSKF